ncbi:hypothetical protein [Nonomuraea sp. NPDC049480]|uniref:hypothetical protein n=1 Tax=Nonomuraea sp. NPDC049480 TaxID=3364353 RepID=UPI0037A8B150
MGARGDPAVPIRGRAVALPVTACSTGGQTTSSAFGRSGSAAASAPRGVVTAAEAKAILAKWGKAEKDAARQGGTDWTAANAGLAAEISTSLSQLHKSLGEPVDWAEKPEQFRRKAVRKIAAMYIAVVPKSPGLVRVPTERATYLSITGS